MAIDKPLDQAKFLVRSDEAQSSALQKPARSAASLISVMANAAKVLKTGNVAEALSSVAQALKGISDFFADQNVEYLLSIVISEVETLWSKFDALDQKHRDFLAKDWPKLLLDGQRRARVIRAKERVQRIAMILRNAAYSEPSPVPDDVEEMMRIAMELGDRDILALSLIAESASGNSWADRLSWQHAWDLFKRVPWRARAFSDSDVESVCSKLASFGLLARLDIPPNQNMTTSMHNGYELLQKGKAFLQFIRSEAQSSAEPAT
jgi:hypothetical protein